MLSPWVPDTTVLLNVCLGRDLHAHRVVAFVQTQHARRHASACDRQRVAMRTHTEPHAVPREIETAATIGTDPPVQMLQSEGVGPQTTWLWNGAISAACNTRSTISCPALLMAADPTSVY
jgi:hypothetical protein